MYSLLMVIHVTACFLVVLVVLMQAGRGAGFTVFGGGGGDSLFSAPTTTGFMKQLTWGLAGTFALTSLLLSLLSSRSSLTSVTTTAPPPMRRTVPAAPAPAPGPAPVSPAPAKK